MNYINFFGHASIYIKTPNVSIVTDPWFSKTGAFLYTWYQFPDNTEIDFNWVKDLDYVCISHEHKDHYDINFLRTIPKSTKIIIPKQYDSFLYDSLTTNLLNEVIQVKTRTKIVMEDVTYTPVTPLVAGWDDCTLMFETPVGTIADLNDMNMTEEDLLFINENFDIDYLFIQYSGASWYPHSYNIYDKKEKIEIVKAKVYNKFKNVLNIFERLNPKYIVPCAGPPCFLDDDWFYLNFADENSFPTQRDFYEYFIKKYNNNIIIISLPDNIINPHSVFFNKATLEHQAFTDKRKYLNRYKERRNNLIKSKIDKFHNFDGSLLKKCNDYFVPLMESSEFLTEKINNKIMLSTESENLVVDFKHKSVYKIINPEQKFTPSFYTFKIESKYLNMILDHELRWEELFLSLRCEIERTPDKYNESLFVFLKFAKPSYFKHYEEQYNKIKRKETFILETNGRKYRIQKYCPHALGDLSKGEIVDNNIICPNHFWKLSFEDGHCINHSSEIIVEKIL